MFHFRSSPRSLCLLPGLACLVLDTEPTTDHMWRNACGVGCSPASFNRHDQQCCPGALTLMGASLLHWQQQQPDQCSVSLWQTAQQYSLLQGFNLQFLAS